MLQHPPGRGWVALQRNSQHRQGCQRHQPCRQQLGGTRSTAARFSLLPGPRHLHSVAVRTAIAAVDGISAGDATGTSRSAEREQADEPTSHFTMRNGVLVLNQPASTSYASSNGLDGHASGHGNGLAHAAVSSSATPSMGVASTSGISSNNFVGGYCQYCGSSSSGHSHNGINGINGSSHAQPGVDLHAAREHRTSLGLDNVTFTVPIQSWGGDDEPHAAQSAAGRAGAEAASAARTASAAAHTSAEEAATASSAPAEQLEADVATDSSSGPVVSLPRPTPQILAMADLVAKPKAKGGGSLGTRVLFGALLGIGGAAAVAIKQLFLFVACFITYHATREYYAMVTSKGITRGMAPPPPIISGLTTVICVSMVLFSYFYTGRSGTVLAVAAFFLLVMNMVAIRKPRFSMLASTLFGVFYCGWLPNFWVKLRFMTAQATPSAMLPSLFGAPAAAWTVGLVATFTTVICVVAADTGAYFVGKTLGQTKLTDISPKKTVEGAVGGLASSVAAAVALWKVTLWPATPAAAAGLGVLAFFSSLFGDLIESIIKRDAGMKDSGDLIPGHGGLLDRFDSYMFTGAVAYFYIVFILPYFPL